MITFYTLFRCILSCTAVVIFLLCTNLDTEVSITYISTKYSFSNCSCGPSTDLQYSYSFKAVILSRSAYHYCLSARLRPACWETLSLDTLDWAPGHRVPRQLLLVGMKCYASGTPRRTVYVLYLKYGPWSPRPCHPSNRHAYISPAEHVTPQLAISHIYYCFFSYFSFFAYFCVFCFLRSPRLLSSHPRLRICAQIYHLDRYTS